MARAVGVLNGNWKNRWKDEVELVQEQSNPNSSYWQGRLAQAFKKIVADEHLADIWDSVLVPEKATFRAHALLAEQIVRGELDAKYAAMIQQAEEFVTR
jgi:hypothetical protein